MRGAVGAGVSGKLIFQKLDGEVAFFNRSRASRLRVWCSEKCVSANIATSSLALCCKRFRSILRTWIPSG